MSLTHLLPGSLGFGTAPMGNMFRAIPEDEAQATLQAPFPVTGYALIMLAAARVSGFLAARPRVMAAQRFTAGGLLGAFAEPSRSEPVSRETVALRLEALTHPVRLRLLRTLAHGPHTTGELAHTWELSLPEVSRHLAVLRRAGLLTARRHGRYLRHTLHLPDLTALGSDLLAAILR